ncbi:MAG: carboxynorspermidine decarboxylase [Bdellovibrionales bacterium]
MNRNDNISRLRELPEISTPAYALDEAALLRNMATARKIREQAGVKLILATKAFAMPQAFPLMRDSLDGTTASGLFEARLGHEAFGKEVHVYSPAFDDTEIEGIAPIAHHVTFNSSAQLKRYAPTLKAKNPKVSLGLRVNPELQLTGQGYAKYNPCGPCSRMGSTRKSIDEESLNLIEGLHFHILCENMAEASVALIDAVERNFGAWLRLPHMKWVNLGGGHFINETGYDVDKLVQRLIAFRQTFPHLEIILEPGGGLVRNAGYLVASVLDILVNDKTTLILDTSATAHMPDVITMPYRPPVADSGQPGEKACTYILAGKTCMTGDIIGEYSFDKPLSIGDRLVFLDMMQYTMVQSTTFNGLPLPDIGILHSDGNYEVLKRFGYEDFAGRIGG